MKIEILLHTIKYRWEDNKQRELNDCDIEHIKKCIEDGYSSGELCQSVFDKDNKFIKDVYGWWGINKFGKKTM